MPDGVNNFSLSPKGVPLREINSIKKQLKIRVPAPWLFLDS